MLIFTYFQYKDHLGNIRLSYADCNNDGEIQPADEILEENNYYPFGLRHKGYNEIANSCRNEAAERYKFGGKEWNSELGIDLYDFGARNYDPALGRWMNIDPLAENSRRWTPYNYAYNNPIFFIDPDGMQALDHGKKRIIRLSGSSQMVKVHNFIGRPNYNYDVGKRSDKTIFPGMTRAQHSHTLPVSPVNTSGSSTEISANYSGSRLVGNDVITSVTEKVIDATGKYYDSNNNLVDNIDKASTYVVDKSIKETTIKVGIGNISETADYKETNTKTVYDITDKSNMKEMGGLQLTNERTSTTFQKEGSMSSSEASQDLLNSAKSSSKFNAGQEPNPVQQMIENVIDRTIYYEEEINKLMIH